MKDECDFIDNNSIYEILKYFINFFYIQTVKLGLQASLKLEPAFLLQSENHYTIFTSNTI